MNKGKSSLKIAGLQPYRGKLDSLTAATGIQAARLNAMDLVETSQVLYDTEKYAHSVAISILAIEECGKGPIIMSVFLELDDPTALWKRYRQHTYKGSLLNPAVTWIARAQFPDLDNETLNKISQGPPPWYLDGIKQMALYSDCFEISHGPWWYLPRNYEWWSAEAKERLDEAKALAYKLRDYPPEELEIWYEHLRQYTKKSVEELKVAIKSLRDELLEKGFIKEGWWDPIIKLINGL